MAVAAAGLLLFVGLGYLALFNRPVLPSPAQSIASSQPLATSRPAASAPASQAQSAPAIAAQPSSAPTVAVSIEFKQNWPSFRGPGGIGVAAEGDWPTTWSLPKSVNIAWSSDVPYDAPSSPILWADRLFLTGADGNTGHVLCFNRSTGEQLWDKSVEPPAGKTYEIPEETGAAVPTPCADGRRVYAIFGTGLLAAFDFDGNQAWLADIGPFDSAYGFASSPIAAENLVIVQADQGNTPRAGLSALLGFDAATGKVAWKTPRPVRGTWSSPALIQTESRSELIATCEPWVTAYDPKTGAELWKVEGLEGDVAPSATFGGGLVFAAQDGSELLAIRPGGAGDVTQTHVVWKAEDGLPDVASPATDGKRLIQVAAGGYVTCYDAQAGKLIWETYLPNSASASPIVAGGRAYIACEDGVTTILALGGDKAQTVGRGELGEGVRATPAFADSRIYLRGEKHLVCVE
ncbi:MAG: PQQ-binding-like beta-propeller repeat protein, partial [Candidatus Sumerlaeota bacterium]|nr:PQQ-binding-like beta-propeller repeat protein [Candidatus Sumerlaeota bacterium]